LAKAIDGSATMTANFHKPRALRITGTNSLAMEILEKLGPKVANAAVDAGLGWAMNKLGISDTAAILSAIKGIESRLDTLTTQVSNLEATITANYGDTQYQTKHALAADLITANDTLKTMHDAYLAYKADPNAAVPPATDPATGKPHLNPLTGKPYTKDDMLAGKEKDFSATIKSYITTKNYGPLAWRNILAGTDNSDVGLLQAWNTAVKGHTTIWGPAQAQAIQAHWEKMDAEQARTIMYLTTLYTTRSSIRNWGPAAPSTT
jgi:hypothetical protein